jgi:hypothetical protein
MACGPVPLDCMRLIQPPTSMRVIAGSRQPDHCGSRWLARMLAFFRDVSYSTTRVAMNLSRQSS